MTEPVRDPRLQSPDWSPPSSGAEVSRRMRLLALVAAPLTLWYFLWLLQLDRIGHPLLYGVLVVAELFNATQAVGFWWTCSREGRRRPQRAIPLARTPKVDVLIPVYDEPLEVVASTVEAATRLEGAHVTVHVLDDGDSDELEALAANVGAHYLRRAESHGAKAGNINHALKLTEEEFVVVFDCDHVPHRDFLVKTLPHLTGDTAFVQTPQYYANHHTGSLSSSAWAQQALFFGVIARGKDGIGSMFCCGTNVVFRRSALESIGGFPEDSLTEDFELSLHLHERGWKSAYVSEVLAQGLGPEDMASYVGQQQRWSRGCLSAIPSIFRARIPLRQRLQYLLSSMYFLTGWTVLIYMSLPVIRITTGAQPLADASADAFLLHFVPYFGFALLNVARAGSGSYSFGAFALSAASFWIHVQSSILQLRGKPARFVVTPKKGETKRQPTTVVPALVAVAVLGLAALFGLVRSQSPATLNNVAFAALHVTVLLAGSWPALAGPSASALGEPGRHETRRAA
ncbi:MAG: glycosyltransferase [Actinomycetota bacterium]